jgi:hypothetical protein
MPPLPANLGDLPNRTTTAVALVNHDMLTWCGPKRVIAYISALSAKVGMLGICKLYKNRNKSLKNTVFWDAFTAVSIIDVFWGFVLRSTILNGHFG